MPAITDVQGLSVVSPAGKRLGTVTHVLFHPSEPRVVGLVVVPPSFLYLLARKPRHIALSAEMLPARGAEERSIAYGARRLPLRGEPTKDLGFDWDDTVIWRHMDVTAEGGGPVGRVADVVFSRSSLRVLKVELSEGALSDAAIGRTEVPGEMVEGFDGGTVVVRPEFLALSPSGGLAAASATGVVHAKHGADKAADAALAAGAAGLAAVERSFTTGLGRKAMRAVRRAQKRASDAMRPDDD